jgi:hypothetical protein
MTEYGQDVSAAGVSSILGSERPRGICGAVLNDYREAVSFTAIMFSGLVDHGILHQ